MRKFQAVLEILKNFVRGWGLGAYPPSFYGGRDNSFIDGNYFILCLFVWPEIQNSKNIYSYVSVRAFNMVKWVTLFKKSLSLHPTLTKCSYFYINGDSIFREIMSTIKLRISNPFKREFLQDNAVHINSP